MDMQQVLVPIDHVSWATDHVLSRNLVLGPEALLVTNYIAHTTCYKNAY